MKKDNVTETELENGTVLNTAVADKKEFIEFKGKIKYETRENWRTKKLEPVAVIYINNPFDAAEVDIEVRIRNVNRRGRFDYYARKMLADKDDLSIYGTVQLKSFLSAKTRSVEYYTTLDLVSIVDDSIEHLEIIDKDKKAAFNMLAKDFLVCVESSEKN